jgi:signal transduction histidine kinase
MFYIKDNGIGFDMVEAQNVFKPFRHYKPGAKSSGAGLAIVSRIINIHGGTIVTDSMPGKGAAFYFTFAEKE